MSATGLPARIVYAVVATPLAAAGGFYISMFLLTRVVPGIEGDLTPQPGWTEFALSLMIAAAVAFPVFWWALTLPRVRVRRRAGRVWRTAFSAAMILAAAVMIRAEGMPLRYTIALIVWMALILMLTFIRYGLVGGDRQRVRRSSGTF